MPEAKNAAAIRKWVEKNRPDILHHLDHLMKSDATLFLLVIGFESGRVYQHENPNNVPGNPGEYLS
jgi:hypothetical protein